VHTYPVLVDIIQVSNIVEEKQDIDVRFISEKKSQWKIGCGGIQAAAGKESLGDRLRFPARLVAASRALAVTPTSQER
jgi:hypothetical protein